MLLVSVPDYGPIRRVAGRTRPCGVSRMKRVTLRIPEHHVDELDEHDDFPNRSEAIRTAVRELLEDNPADGKPGHEMWAKGSGDD